MHLHNSICHLYDITFSPRKSFQPIEIVVRHNKVIEGPYNSDSEDEEPRRGRKRLSTLHEGMLFLIVF